MAYVDFRAAFDSVNRQSFWLLLKTKGVPQKKLIFLRICIPIQSAVSESSLSQVSDWFSIYAGVRQGCAVAPDLFMEPIDWITSRSVHQGFVGVSLGQEVFTDLDFADDASIMAEMLEVLILALEIRNEESSALGLEINWNKTKIQASDIIIDAPPDVTILDHKVNVVDSFVYLGSSINASGRNNSDIRRRIELAHTCMKLLDRGIWHSSISLVTKLRLYNVYILPVLLYGSDTLSVTEASRQGLDAFDQWCLCHILRVPYTAHITNVSVQSQTNQPPVSSLIQQHRLKLFGPQAVWAYTSGCSLRGQLTCATSIHHPQSPPC